MSRRPLVCLVDPHGNGHHPMYAAVYATAFAALGADVLLVTPASLVHAMPHFECNSCHRDSPISGALSANAQDLERAAQTALHALQALGYKGVSMDFAVRGVCVDCATGATP